MPLSQTFPQIKTSKWVSHSTALKLRTHWVQPNSNYELIDYQWVRVHSKFCTQLRLHSNYELIECSRTQITNSLSAAALKLRTHWLSVSSYALKVSHSTAAALKLRTHWLSVSSYALKVLRSNYELIECSRTQITNSLIISEFVCTQSLALNCPQKMD